MRLRQFGLLVTVASTTVSACGDENKAAPAQGVVAADTSGGSEDVGPEPDPDVGPSVDTTPIEEDTGPTVPNVFKYATTGTDGQACVDSCAVTVEAGAKVDLSVVYLDGTGKGIPEIGVRWTADNEDAVKLGAKTTFTDETGKATVSVEGVTAAGSVIIRGALADDAAGTDLPFTLTVTAGATNAAAVSYTYTGVQNVPGFEVRLYRTLDSNATCESVDPDAPGSKPTPTVTKPGTAGQTVGFATLPGLVEGNTETWLAQVVGPVANPSVEGCATFEATSGTTAEVQVVLNDLALRYSGEFGINTKLDLYTGLNGTAGSAIAFIVQLFDSPGAVALEAACKNPSGVLDVACNFLVDNSGKPAGAGVTVAKTADEAFYDLIAGFLGPDVAFAGDSIASLLKEMRFQSTLEFGSEPTIPTDGELAFEAGSVAEEWKNARYLWKFGKGCSPTDDECGYEAVKLSDVYGANPTAQPSASVNPSNGLSVAVHEVNGFDYGQLVSYLLEHRVLPSLFGDGVTAIDDPQSDCDGAVTPRVDTYGKVVAMIFGDKCCLYFAPSGGSSEYGDCCEFFASKPEVQPYEYYDGLTQSACELLIPAADNYLRDIVSDVGGNLVIGTDVPCQATDATGDRKVDALGSPAAPCTWDATVDFSGGNFSPENSWSGVK